ncbi:hypothetical protein K439DRAFT_871456 [Ramaria rubella]|nr:hypothetical protein K439DRAFT_871456 [Ramaria rubella]
MSTCIPPHIKVDDTLGAALIGGLLTAFLFGMTLLQTFSYFRTFGNDPKGLKAFVFGVLLSDAAHMGLVIHVIYWYLITNYLNPEAVTMLPTSFAASIVVTNISDVAIRLFYCHRVWIMSRGSKLLTLPLIVLIVVLFVSGFGYGAKSSQLHTVSKLHSISWLLYTAFSLSLVVDAYIALSLCILLSTSRSVMCKANSIIDILIVYTVNTGVITSISAAVSLFTYVAMPNNFIFIASYFPLSKFYVNALLATLNARETLRNVSRGQGNVDVSSPCYSPRMEVGNYPNETNPQSQTSYPLEGAESGKPQLTCGDSNVFVGGTYLGL